MSDEKKIGRPSIFTQEIADIICDRISTSNASLRTICSEEGMPGVTTVLRWVRENESFRQQYARAKEQQADFLAEEMMEIADDSSKDILKDSEGNEYENKEFVNRSRLRVDTRKWIASKLKPKKYGDSLKLDQTVTNVPVIIDMKNDDPNLPDSETKGGE